MEQAETLPPHQRGVGWAAHRRESGAKGSCAMLPEDWLEEADCEAGGEKI